MSSSKAISVPGKATQNSDELKASVDSPSARIWRRFRRHRLAILGSTIFLVLVIGAVFAPVLTAHDPLKVDLAAYRAAPTSDHILGTDSAGRDVFSRILYAGRVSLAVGIGAVSIYTLIGLVLGTIAGFAGGYVDGLIMRATDTMLSFPPLIIILTLVTLIGPKLSTVILVIGLLGWPSVCRIVRGVTLSVREQEYITAAEATGVQRWRIILYHVLPNVLAPVIIAATFGVAHAILLEAGLSFLGLGVRPPTPSWGNMLNEARTLTILESMPWLWIPPGLMIALAVLSINFIGDGLRDALDPRSTKG